jgi:hypothetical protein
VNESCNGQILGVISSHSWQGWVKPLNPLCYRLLRPCNLCHNRRLLQIKLLKFASNKKNLTPVSTGDVEEKALRCTKTERTSKSLIDLACGEQRGSESSQNDRFVSRILNRLTAASIAVIGEAVLGLLLGLSCPCVVWGGTGSVSLWDCVQQSTDGR